MFFGLNDEVREWRHAARINAELAFRFYKAAFQHDIYLMHSWHHGFSAAHSEQDIDAALDGIEASICEAMKG